MIAVMSDIFSDLSSRERALPKGRYLFHQGDVVQSMFQIVEGEVQLIRRHRQGQKLILQRGQQGNILAEASLFTDAYHCDAIAAVGSKLRCFTRNDVLNQFESNPTFAKQWANHLAYEIRAARFKAEILSQRTVAHRLDTWLLQNGELPNKGNWKQLASEIGTSAEALYRELAARE
jgi:CRP-like cAMP-binding protein